MMGERTVMQEALFYEFSSNVMCRPITCCARSTGSSTCPDLRSHLRPFYSEIGPALDRSGADDPDADRRLLLRHPLGAAAVRGGASEPGLSLVLPARPGRRRAGPLDLLEEPAWPLPRQRSAARAVRDDGAPLHRGRAGRRRGLRGRRQPDQGRRQQAALGGRVGSRSTGRRWRRPAARCGSISTRWTRPPGARPARSSRSSSRGPIPRRNGPAR